MGSLRLTHPYLSVDAGSSLSLIKEIDEIGEEIENKPLKSLKRKSGKRLSNRMKDWYLRWYGKLTTQDNNSPDLREKDLKNLLGFAPQPNLLKLKLELDQTIIDR